MLFTVVPQRRGLASTIRGKSQKDVYNMLVAMFGQSPVHRARYQIMAA